MMSGEVLMDVIGSISDKYVMEFADISNKKIRVFRKKFLACAACMIFVISILGTMVLKMDKEN